MSNLRLIQIIEELSKLTAGLISGPNQRPTQYQKVLEGVARRAYITLYSINCLADDNFNGDAILDLSRSLLEDMISIEFMKLKGKEEMAKKFMDYMAVEHKMDLDFLVRNNSKPEDKVVKSVEEDFKKVERDFTFRPGQLARSWAKCQLEDMVNELLKAGVFKDLDKDMILQAYIMGNRKNHLSPIDVLSFMHQTLRDMNQSGSVRTGLVFAIVCYFKIIIEFAQEMKQEKLVKDLESLWKEFNLNLEEEKED